MQVVLFPPKRTPTHRNRRGHPRNIQDIRREEDAFYEENARPFSLSFLAWLRWG